MRSFMVADFITNVEPNTTANILKKKRFISAVTTSKNSTSGTVQECH